MATENKVELHIPSVMGYEKIAMETAASMAKRKGFTEDRLEELKTAVAETCINAIEHGNEMDSSTKVAITLTAEESKLQVTVRDEGKGVGKTSSPSIESKIEGKDKTRGWGIFLIKSLMNEVKFEPSPEGGNVVKMIIYLEKHPHGVRNLLHALRGFVGLVELHGYSGRFGTCDIQETPTAGFLSGLTG